MLYFASLWAFCNYQSVLLDPFAFFSQFPTPLPLWQPSVCSLHQWVCFNFVCSFILFFTLHIWVKSYGVCLSLTDLLHSATCPLGSSILLQMVKISFFFMAELYSDVYRYCSFFIHSPADGHLGCFHILTSVNIAAMNTGVHTFFRISVSLFFAHILRSGIAGS